VVPPDRLLLSFTTWDEVIPRFCLQGCGQPPGKRRKLMKWLDFYVARRLRASDEWPQRPSDPGRPRARQDEQGSKRRI